MLRCRLGAPSNHGSLSPDKQQQTKGRGGGEKGDTFHRQQKSKTGGSRPESAPTTNAARSNRSPVRQRPLDVRVAAAREALRKRRENIDTGEESASPFRRAKRQTQNVKTPTTQRRAQTSSDRVGTSVSPDMHTALTQKERLAKARMAGVRAGQREASKRAKSAPRERPSSIVEPNAGQLAAQQRVAERRAKLAAAERAAAEREEHDLEMRRQGRRDYVPESLLDSTPGGKQSRELFLQRLRYKAGNETTEQRRVWKPNVTPKPLGGPKPERGLRAGKSHYSSHPPALDAQVSEPVLLLDSRPHNAGGAALRREVSEGAVAGGAATLQGDGDDLDDNDIVEGPWADTAITHKEGEWRQYVKYKAPPRNQPVWGGRKKTRGGDASSTGVSSADDGRPQGLQGETSTLSLRGETSEGPFNPAGDSTVGLGEHIWHQRLDYKRSSPQKGKPKWHNSSLPKAGQEARAAVAKSVRLGDAAAAPFDERPGLEASQSYVDAESLHAREVALRREERESSAGRATSAEVLRRRELKYKATNTCRKPWNAAKAKGGVNQERLETAPGWKNNNTSKVSLHERVHARIHDYKRTPSSEVTKRPLWSAKRQGSEKAIVRPAMPLDPGGESGCGREPKLRQETSAVSMPGGETRPVFTAGQPGRKVNYDRHKTHMVQQKRRTAASTRSSLAESRSALF